MRNSNYRLAALTVAILVAAGCTTQQRVRTETALAQALVSDDQSRQLGAQMHAELGAQGVRYTNDAVIRKYVGDISARILPRARLDRPGMDYQIHVIDDVKTVNAFATPGGHIYVYTGLLVAAEDEAEVAGVLAHEAGHVVGRHIERAMVNSYGLQALSAMALGQNRSLITELAASIAATGVMRAHGRSEEIEADEYGARYTGRAGYDPRAMITFFQKLETGSSRVPAGMGWLSTHPLPQDRIDNLREFLSKKKGLTGTNRNVARHQEMKKRLVSAPAGY